jgi:copper chaperone CopZ
MTHTYTISGMTCGSCVARVKSELLKLGNIQSADVQLATPQAVITMDKHVATGVLQEAVHKAGNYTIAEADGGMKHMAADQDKAEANSYYPIFLIFAYITGITLLIQFANGSFQWMQWMSQFMGGFFLVFSFFKLMNLRGFAEGYGSYDVVAKKLPVWGFVYPFVELGLAIAFLTGFEPFVTNVVTLVVMGISSIGVIQSLLRKTPFQCACLGTVIKLPLSKVTLFEDLLMVGMSAVMIVTML